MPQLSPEQEKKLRRLAKALDNKEIGVLEVLDEVEAKLEQDIETIYAVVQEALAIAEQTKKLEGKKGDKGEKGERGLDGKDGKDGRDGKDGKDGIDGKTGPQGLPGKDGKDGKDGVDGKDGADGFIDEATIGYLEAELKRIDKKNGGYGQVVRKLRAGNNISIDDTNMEYPTISVTPQITVSDTAPTSPALNDLWVDTSA